MKHIEMIEDYIIEQSDSPEYNPPSYKWNDNHGELIRCRDCAHMKEDYHNVLTIHGYNEYTDFLCGYIYDEIGENLIVSPDEYCSHAVKRGDDELCQR